MRTKKAYLVIVILLLGSLAGNGCAQYAPEERLPTFKDSTGIAHDGIESRFKMICFQHLYTLTSLHSNLENGNSRLNPSLATKGHIIIISL